MSNKFDVDYIRKYGENFSIKELSEMYAINMKTIASIIRLYKNTGRTNKKETRNRNPNKLSENVVTKIQSCIDEDATITLKNIQSLLIRKENVQISLTSINNAIKSFNYSFKMIKNIPERRNSEDNIIRRYDYAMQFINLNQNKVIFLDETGISVSSRCKRGRSVIGTTPIQNVRQLRSINYSICASVTQHGMFLYEVQKGSYNGARFSMFMEKLFSNLYAKDMSNMKIIVDNCAIHKTKDIITLVTNNGHELLFLPPYSPFLNPIEEAFSKWKNYILMKKSENQNDLEISILGGFSNITSEDCQGYFTHMRSFLSKCIKREVIH